MRLILSATTFSVVGAEALEVIIVIMEVVQALFWYKVLLLQQAELHIP
jgi:hypothetical protein